MNSSYDFHITSVRTQGKLYIIPFKPITYFVLGGEKKCNFRGFLDQFRPSGAQFSEYRLDDP